MLRIIFTTVNTFPFCYCSFYSNVSNIESNPKALAWLTYFSLASKQNSMSEKNRKRSCWFKQLSKKVKRIFSTRLHSSMMGILCSGYKSWINLKKICSPSTWINSQEPIKIDTLFRISFFYFLLCLEWRRNKNLIAI